VNDSLRARGIWGEIALALALISLAAILLNAGVFWLLLKTSEADRRLELGETLVRTIATQLEVEAAQEGRSRGYRKVLDDYAEGELGIEELYVVNSDMEIVAAVSGSPPDEPDDGLREALFGKQSHVEVDGPIWDQRSVLATAPVAPQGNVVGAVRIRLPLLAPVLPGGLAGFVLAYTLSSGLVIAVFGFSLFRRRLIGPIRDIQEGTKLIARGDFTHRVEVDASLELQDLCVSLNQLGSSLGAYRERTESHVEELEAANIELRRAQEALVRSERLASVGRLAAGLAHELGNPLAAVLGYVELLGTGLNDPALESDLLRRSQLELQRIHRLLRGLLDHAHPGKEEVLLLDPTVAIQEAISRLEPQPALQGVEMSVEFLSHRPVRIVPEKLQQVLVNLSLNAVDSMAGLEVPTIHWQVEAVREGTEIRCIDQGTGFSEVAKDQAFEPFFTTKDVGEGTGLGLFTCMQLVEAAGGNISVSNRAEGGAMVTIWLPQTETLNETD
jgi:two-component system NtrC family sensor kinase